MRALGFSRGRVEQGQGPRGSRQGETKEQVSHAACHQKIHLHKCYTGGCRRSPSISVVKMIRMKVIPTFCVATPNCRSLSGLGLPAVTLLWLHVKHVIWPSEVSGSCYLGSSLSCAPIHRHIPEGPEPLAMYLDISAKSYFNSCHPVPRTFAVFWRTLFPSVIMITKSCHHKSTKINTLKTIP